MPACAATASADTVSGYSYVKDHVLGGSPDGGLSDYQVMFILHRGSGSDAGQDVYLGGHSQSWPNDFRFTDQDGNLLSYWVESSDADAAVAWVKVGSIPRSPAITSVRLYYGKAGDTGASDGPATFLLFDDFNYCDPGRWNVGGSPAFANSAVNLRQAGDYLQSTQTFDSGSTVTRARIYSDLPQDYFTCYGYGGYQPWDGWGYLDQDGAYVWFEYSVARNLRWFIGSNITLTGPPLTAGDTWHIYNVYTDPSRQTVFVDRDGSMRLSGSSYHAISGSKNIFFGRHYLANGSADIEADWILVRKHTPTEPVHGNWGGEQQPGLPTATSVPTATSSPTVTPTPTPAPDQGSPAGYSYQKSHVITGSPDGYLADYPVKFVVHRGAGSDSGQDVYLNGCSQSWPYDIRFTGPGGKALSYWLESANGESAVAWVKIPSIPAAGTTIDLLYGKPGDRGASDGGATFDFFSGFDDLEAFDRLGMVTTSDGIATIQPAGPYWYQLSTKQTFPDNRRIRCSLKSAHGGLVPELYEIFFSAEGSPADGITWPSYEQANYGDAQQFYASSYEWNTGGQATGTVGLLGWSAGEYHTQELLRHGQATWLVDGGNRVDCGPAKYDTGPQHVGIKVYGYDGRVDVDWLFVSKYTEHEPGHGAWDGVGGESTPAPTATPVQATAEPTSTPIASPIVPGPVSEQPQTGPVVTAMPVTTSTPVPTRPAATPINTSQGFSQLALLLMGAVALFIIICAVVITTLIIIVVIDQRIHR